MTEELPRETQKAVRDELRKAVEPVRDRAQADLIAYLAQHPHGRGRKSKFGITVRRTGVVSVEQRVRSKGKAGKRPKFSDLQLDEALLPAAEKAGPELDRSMVDVLERLQRKWVTG